ncbi:MAG: DUF3443 family protein [Proteobacteria bacterium]|nr:DUF3443 family protein [Pseudomonadota bacterium]
MNARSNRPSPRRPFALHAWLPLAFVLAACGGGGGSSPMQSTTGVPNVVGLSQAAATSALTGAGLAVGSVTIADSTTVASGDVISETPAAGTSVAPGSSVALSVSDGTGPGNSLAVTIDAGPAAITQANQAEVNIMYASVTICTPGSTTACQTIDHVQVDTGSVGLEILAEAMNGSAVPVPVTDAASGSPVRECVVFADGYTWGSIATVDVTLGSRTIHNLPIHVIGDTAAGTAPTTCSSGSGPIENSIVQFGANGVIGVGNFLQDCGTVCASTVVPQLYYACGASSCQPTTVPVANQLQNPVAMLSTDNNGVVVMLPALTGGSARTVSGTLYFGIGTQANNALNSAAFYTLDGSGYLITKFGTQTLANSFIDSGSNAYFFNSSIATCTSMTYFYCPATSVAESATIQGQNGATQLVNFTIDNAQSLFASTNSAYANLGGPDTVANAPTNSFDWGLPFFFGRPVFVLFETRTAGATTGPAVGF